MAIAKVSPARTEVIAQAVAMPVKHGRRVISTALTAGAAVIAFIGTVFTALSALMAYKVVKRGVCVVQDLHESARLKGIELAHSVVEEISFHSEDGLKLQGTFYAGKCGDAIIICHGFRGCSLDVQGAAAELNVRGHSVLTFDFRGHGRSDGKQSSIGYKERRDLCAAVQYLKARPEVDPQRIGVIGMSMGAATAILTAAECPDIKAVVADSSFATLREVVYQGFKTMFKLPAPLVAAPMLMFSEMFAGFKTQWVRPIDAVAAIAPRPILFIHSRADDLIGWEQCDKLYAAATGPKQQWLVEQAGHARAGVMYYDEYCERVNRFFDEALAAAVES